MASYRLTIDEKQIKTTKMLFKSIVDYIKYLYIVKAEIILVRSVVELAGAIAP